MVVTESGHTTPGLLDALLERRIVSEVVEPTLEAARAEGFPFRGVLYCGHAPYGRTGVYMMQEYCRRLGVGTSKEEIDDLTVALKLLPQQHPLLATVRGSRDFLNAEALFDSLLHPRDRAYSVPELFDFIERNDLMLGRWRWQAPYLPQCGLIAESPHASRLLTLPEREQYMAMELWRGLMTIHSLVVHRSDMNNSGLKVRFDDERYLRYVPIRLPWTIFVQEALPAGVSGILLNQTHVFDDLMLFIDAREKRMFEAIDGRRSISEILDKSEREGNLAALVQEALVVRPGCI